MRSILGQEFSISLVAAALVAWVLHYTLITSGTGVDGFDVSVAISGGLTATCLMIVAFFSSLSRMSLLAALSLFVLVQFLMMQLEAAIFGLGEISAAAIIGLIFVSVVLASPFAIASFIERQSSENLTTKELKTEGISVFWRIVLCATAFPIIYFLAGITILPFVERFYSGLIPSLHVLMLWQWFRGLIFTLSVIPLVLHFSQPRIVAAAVFAVVFPTIGGIAPLLLPNATMPPEVRFVHSLEIAASYIVYGGILGYFLRPVGKRNSIYESTA